MKKHDYFLLIIRSLLGYFLATLAALVFFVPALILVAVLPNGQRAESRFLFWLLDCGYKSILKVLFVPIRIEGKGNMPQEPAIFVANHASSLDIPVMGALMDGHPHMWYVFERYSKVPVLGFFVRRMCVTVYQTQGTKDARALIQGIRMVDKKPVHTIIFPEGGRYLDEKVHDFFAGFAMIAKKTQRPVVPVMIYNLGKVYPPGAFWVHDYPVRILIGKPFLYHADESTQEFVQRVRMWFLDQAA